MSTTPGDPPGRGARIDDMTPHDDALYSDGARLQSYDIVLADCEQLDWDGQFTDRDANGPNVVEYVNRGGRFFASHLSFSWLHENGTTAYDETSPFTTGLGPAATWRESADAGQTTGVGAISVGRPQASPRIDSFAQWMVNEGITNETTTPPFSFDISDPREQNMSIGESTEEFVINATTENVQQFSFNTPYGAPEAPLRPCRLQLFHVSIGNTSTSLS